MKMADKSIATKADTCQPSSTRTLFLRANRSHISYYLKSHRNARFMRFFIVIVLFAPVIVERHENNRKNGQGSFTPALGQAAYNYQFIKKHTS